MIQLEWYDDLIQQFIEQEKLKYIECQNENMNIVSSM